MYQPNKYGLRRAYRTPQGCEVLEIRTIYTQWGGNQFIPVTHICMSCPEIGVDKPKVV
jgi:hypothetical protein